jgi:hypothetical protein
MSEHLIPQPVQIDTNSNVDDWTYQQTDTELIAKLVRGAIEQDGSGSGTSADSQSLLTRLAEVLSTLVNAEFAFCLLTPEAAYYARDSFGRRSLLVSSSQDQSTTSTSTPIDDVGDSDNSVNPIWKLSSVATSGDGFIYKEVEPGQIFSYTFHSGGNTLLALAIISVTHICRSSSTRFRVILSRAGECTTTSFAFKCRSTTPHGSGGCLVFQTQHALLQVQAEWTEIQAHEE